MPVLEIKQLDASHSEAQRINSSGACELPSTQKNTHKRRIAVDIVVACHFFHLGVRP